MSFANAEEARKHRNIYLLVFLSLAVLTVVTVAIARFHLPIAYAVSLAVLVASIKATLVAAFFMHLISERKAIYWTLFLTAIFFLLLMALPILTVGESQHWADTIVS